MRWPGQGAAGRGSGDGWRPAGLALAGTLLLAASGQAARPVYTLGSVQARDGNPIQDETGLLYSARFDPACNTLVGAIASPAFSAALQGGKPATLEIQAAACRTSEPPQLACTLSLGGGSVSSPPDFRGWRLTLPLPLPKATGIYPARLVCRIAGRTVAVPPATLYLTYGPPLASLGAPRRVWYERACTWGADLTAAASEETVLRHLLAGQYRYGQRHWRYGFCQISADGKRCTFGSTVVDPKDSRLRCASDLSPPICWCPWDTLVQGDSTFNFGDCFKFSDSLQFIAAATGVGVGQSETTGKFDEGLATRPALKSLDPAFPGNLRCGGPLQPPSAYVFGNHSLVFQDLLLFDSTFGRVYQDEGGLIGESALSRNGNVQFPSFWACLRPGDYGTFPFFRKASSCPRDGSRPATFGPAPPRPVVVRHGEARSLAVELELEVHRPGEYRVTGGIYGGKDGKTPIVVHSLDRSERLSEATLSALSSTRETVRLFFSGEALAHSSLPGPYVLHATLIGDKGVADSLTTRLDLQGIPLQELGERPARFGAATAIRARIVTDGSGRRAVRLQVPVTVRVPGSLALEGWLTQGATTLYAGGLRSLTREDREMTMDFPVEERFQLRQDGSYKVTLGLSLPDPPDYVDSVWATVTPAPPAGGASP